MITASAEVREEVARAVARLASATPVGDAFIVDVPVLYPSGKGAAVQVQFHRGRCVVSDMGLGHLEAEMEGGGDGYSRWARFAAEEAGISYDGQSLFVLEVSPDRLDGAIVLVANTSCRAVTITMVKAQERKERSYNAELFERVTSLFPTNLVSRQEEVEGEFHKWDAHNVVRLPDRRPIIFEAVSPHQNSVASKVTMFLDIGQRTNAPSRVAVARDLSKMQDFAGILGNVAHVIEFSAQRIEYERHAIAA